MAVVVKKSLVCDVQRPGHGGDLAKWTIIASDGQRKTFHVCARHGKALDTLWEALEPPRRDRKPLRVWGDLANIPRV